MQENNISTGNFEQCQKCSLCETVCPVMANNPDYGGPKRSGPDGQRYRLKNGIFYDDSLKYCLNCKRCEVACPSGVRIADLIQQARIEFSQKSPKLRDVMLASTDQMGPLASAVAPIVNFSLGLAPVKGLLDLTIGLDHRRTLPKYSSETFVHWFNKNAASKQDSYKKHISYFHGCYANYNYPQLAKDFVAVMNAFGYGVHLIEGERCCGVAKIVNGMIPAATRDAKANMSAFSKSLVKGRDIITVSTTCTMTLLEEYPELLKVDNSGIKEHISLVEPFLYKAIESGELMESACGIPLPLPPGKAGTWHLHDRAAEDDTGPGAYRTGKQLLRHSRNIRIQERELQGVADDRQKAFRRHSLRSSRIRSLRMRDLQMANRNVNGSSRQEPGQHTGRSS